MRRKTREQVLKELNITVHRSSDMPEQMRARILDAQPSADEIATGRWADETMSIGPSASGELERRFAEMERLKNETMSAQEQFNRVQLAMLSTSLQGPTHAEGFSRTIRLLVPSLMIIFIAILGFGILARFLG